MENSQQTTKRWADRRTDRQRDRQTDRPSYSYSASFQTRPGIFFRPAKSKLLKSKLNLGAARGRGDTWTDIWKHVENGK